ncbi:hypothetical protein JR316_0003033 [Psilocybe cubensis]|uniref:Uncharacterized protein n=2 Tax=Psilocybe cubensis TaxID=181762 RepID=A0A8H8CND7_PSICU|nr:hypothetical protein JR316_0003033 [Psilocybe cubensis]KAH9483563.1 hypothetical protein JR316_0003033 [Psilocybe cubensis]
MACLVTASPVPAPAPGLGIPLLSGGAESSSNAASSPLAILDNLSALPAANSAPNANTNAVEAPVADPATAGGLAEPLKPLSLLGRVVAYRREHRERDLDDEEEYERQERDAAPAMMKRAERFQLAMMRRAAAARA